MNWDALGRETVELCREHLTLDTTNPPGNEAAGARFLSPFVLRDDEWRRVHGNDERISLENLEAGVRCQTELRLDVAAA